MFLGKGWPSVTLKNEVKDKAVAPGNLSQEEGENIYPEIDYLAYSVDGAFVSGELAVPSP